MTAGPAALPGTWRLRAGSPARAAAADRVALLGLLLVLALAARMGLLLARPTIVHAD